MTAPYIPFYLDDFDGATHHLSLIEEGVYMRLLKLSWRTPCCALPNDDAWIARKIRMSTDEYETIGKPILQEFFTLQRGRWVQVRLKKEYDKLADKKRERSEAGRKGVAAKALKNNKNCVSIAGRFAEPQLKQPEPEPEKKKKEPSVPKKTASKRCPADWSPSADDMAVGPAEGLSELDVRRELLKFRDYEFGTARSDWSATYRNWIRRAAETRRRAAPTPVRRQGFV